jgi:hypothetical protein
VPSVAGGWLGTYHFDDPRHGLPCDFEATFSAVGPDGTFSGKILDDNPLGEATIHHARQVGDDLLFTKVYRLKAPGLVPLRFAGKLLNEGKLLRGTWASFESRRGRLSTVASGLWEARRTWDELSPG